VVQCWTIIFHYSVDEKKKHNLLVIKKEISNSKSI